MQGGSIHFGPWVAQPVLGVTLSLCVSLSTINAICSHKFRLRPVSGRDLCRVTQLKRPRLLHALYAGWAFGDWPDLADGAINFPSAGP